MHALAFTEEALRKFCSGGAEGKPAEAAAAEAVRLFTQLQRVDPIRSAYWSFRAASVTTAA